MFNALFKVFLVWFLVCLFVSGYIEKERPQLSLLAECMGIMGLVAMGIGAAMMLLFGMKEDLISFLGSLPVLVLCFLAIFSTKIRDAVGRLTDSSVDKRGRE